MKIIMKYEGVLQPCIGNRARKVSGTQGNNHDTPPRNIPLCFYLMLHILITKNI